MKVMILRRDLVLKRIMNSSRLAGLALILGLLTETIPASAVTRGYTGTQVFSTVGGNKDPNEPNHCGEPGGASSWFFCQAPRSGTMVVDTAGSSFDTVLAVYIGPGNSYSTLTNVDCNNNAGPGTNWSRVVFNVTSNTMYYIAVDGVGGASGTVKLNYQVGDTLTITNQPQGLVRPVGSNATFTVAATGLGNLSYQWLYYGAPITGATQTSFTLPAVQLSYDGPYSVQVRDSFAQINSFNAPLTVSPTFPATNHVGVGTMNNGNPRYLRVTGHAAVGSVLEVSDDLNIWSPVCTNTSLQGLFTIDDAMDRPQRYYRVRLKP